MASGMVGQRSTEVEAPDARTIMRSRVQHLGAASLRRSRVYTRRSCSRLGMLCQNSMRFGTRRNPDQCGGRGTGPPAKRASISRTRTSSTPGCSIGWLCSDAHAPSWLPRAREAKYASASAALTGVATPLDADLPLERLPVKAHRRLRMREELAPLPALVVGVERRSRARPPP